MIFELLIIPILFLLSVLLIRRDFKLAVKLMLILSLFLHKEVFSIYKWDILPIRIFMLGLLGYAVCLCYRYLKEIKEKSTHKVLEDFHSVLHDPFVISLLLLWFIRAVSLFFTKNLGSSVMLLGFFTTIVAMGYFLYSRFKESPENVLEIITFYIKIVFISCLFGYFQLFLFYYKDFTIGALWSVPGHTPRVGSVFWDVNHYGALLAALMPVLGVLILFPAKLNSWKKRFSYIAMFGVMLSILLLTNSRTAWIAAFITLAVFIMVILFKKFSFKGIFGLFLVFILFLIPLVREYNIKSSPFRREIKDYFHYRIDSFDSHLLLLRGTFEIFEKHPILGGGYGGFYEHFSETKIAAIYLGRDPAGLNTRVPAHTIWGELISETGILGLSAYIILMFVIIGTIFYAAFNTKEKSEFLLTTAMGATLVGWLTAGIFYSYKSEFFWIIVFLYFIYAVSILKNKFIFEKVVSFYFRSEKFILVVFCIIAAVLIFWKLGTNHLIPWDEAIYAKIAKNMFTTKEYLVMKWWPDQVWFEKPPLYMWLTTFFMNFFGVTSFAARFSSAIFGFFTVLLTYFFGKRLYNKTVGIVSAFVLLTTFQFLYYSRTGMLDVAATFFITLALYFYWKATEDLLEKFWVFVGIAVGLAVMIKGVVGLLPFLVIFAHQGLMIFSRREKITKELTNGLFYAVISSLLVFLPWHIAMYQKFGQAFVDNYIGYHVLQRASQGIEDKGNPIYWYVIVLKVSLRIWFIALLLALPSLLVSTITKFRKVITKNTRFAFHSHNKDLFLMIYVCVIFVFFSIAKSKLVWYIIPIYPATALVVGLFIERIVRAIAPRSLVYKSFLIFLIFSGGLFYLFVEKDLVYTSDLTLKQSSLIMKKDELFGVDSKLYADRIELPLLLFYSDGPFEVVDFGPLHRILTNTLYDESVIFITKESRLRAYKEEFEEIDLKDRMDEWVLGYKPSEKELDVEQLRNYNREIEEINIAVMENSERNRITSSATYIKLEQLIRLRDDLQEKINTN